MVIHNSGPYQIIFLNRGDLRTSSKEINPVTLTAEDFRLSRQHIGRASFIIFLSFNGLIRVLKHRFPIADLFGNIDFTSRHILNKILETPVLSLLIGIDTELDTLIERKLKKEPA